MIDKKPIIFLLGPSAAGKTTLGQWVAEDLRFHWAEIDTWGADGIDLAGIRTEWNNFLNTGEAAELATAICQRMLRRQNMGAILTFSSLVVFDGLQLSGLKRAGIQVFVLFGGRRTAYPPSTDARKRLVAAFPRATGSSVTSISAGSSVDQSTSLIVSKRFTTVSAVTAPR